MQSKKYYLGLDIGTDSVGYAVTDEEYNLLKFHGEPAWGVTIFDAASLQAERRNFRSARRRLDRRQQRVTLTQELFAEEIAKVDPKFFTRIKESNLFREEVGYNYTLFNDNNYTDKDYHNEYPTIHHLIYDLMKSNKEHDVRLVYLACAWLVSHRGHFLSNIDRNNLNSVKDFTFTYNKFLNFFANNDNCSEAPWKNCDEKQLGNILKKKQNVTAKNKELIALLFDGKKPSKEATDEFPYNREAIVKLLAGGTVKPKDLFCNDEYEELSSITLSMEEEKYGELMSAIGEDYELIDTMRSIYDWAVLVDVLGDSTCISEAKTKTYKQHQDDLKNLKDLTRKYCSKEQYNDIFRKESEKNYSAYSKHEAKGKKANKETFSKYLLSIFSKITPDKSDEAKFNDMISRLELQTFLPKQKDTDNRVIPNQLYWHELKTILDNAEQYLPFLNETDTNGLTVKAKILSIFEFRIPYFVGPLNKNSDHAWIVKRKYEKVYPWNFNEVVDLEQSEEEFIKRMTNKCTYLPGEDVLPKDSLCYHRFMVLNEINNIKINGEKISVDLKQEIYNNVFLCKKKVTIKYLQSYLVNNGYLIKGEEEALSGLDININSNLVPQIAFKKLIESSTLTENDVEKIIARATFAEDKSRLAKWLDKSYPDLPEEEKKYICSLKIKDFGRLSNTFLNKLEGTDKSTGEVFTIMSALWNTQNNLMELLSDEKFTFADEVKKFRSEYYSTHSLTLEKKLDEMYVSNAVRRPIYRTLDIIKDVEKAFGKPEKIFIEMARGGSPDQKGKRTKSRKQQILDLYATCKDEDVKRLKQQLEEMGEKADTKLQGDKLFLYYMQLGKSMYSNTAIDLNELLTTKKYDVDHIYPQAFVKDDSIINNKVLVLSSENGAKSDKYPINENIRHNQFGYWKRLKDIGLISEEKFKRLTRSTPFSEDEKRGFISRQLTETSQSTKAIASLLTEKYPNATIVYCKARLTSEFRHEFDLYKSRTYNDLHHAVDAYLNIVTGNVYNMKFNRAWFRPDSNYSVNTKPMFTHELICNGKTVWDGQPMLNKVIKTAQKNNAHFTKYAFFKHGGLFDQMPVKAAEGLTPLKNNLPTEKYGGYNKAGAMFYIPVKYTQKNKTDTFIMSVELLHGQKFLKDENYAIEYSYKRLEKITGNKVENISFPMGMRPWKVNTVLSLDGFRVCIAGIGSGGKCLVAQPIMQFSSTPYWNYYLKKLEEFNKKTIENKNHIYDESYDKVSVNDNIKLFEIYIDKFSNSIYGKRVNNPIDTLVSGLDKFKELEIVDQTKVLLNVHQLLCRLSGGVDLTLIGGAGKAGATVSFPAKTSNWAKTYTDVRIVDVSSSGLWEKKSENLLEIL